MGDARPAGHHSANSLKASGGGHLHHGQDDTWHGCVYGPPERSAQGLTGNQRVEGQLSTRRAVSQQQYTMAHQDRGGPSQSTHRPQRRARLAVAGAIVWTQGVVLVVLERLLAGVISRSGVATVPPRRLASTLPHGYSVQVT